MKMTFEELESEFEKRVRKLNPTNIFDMAEINQKSAEILGEIVSENVFNFYNIEAVCKGILQRYFDKMNETNSALQKKYDEKNGLQITPQKADFPTERVTQIAESLTDTTVPPETIQRRARNAIENVANSFHDDYVRKNAEFRSKAGIKCYIVRETNGKCCKWCSSLAGRYLYVDAPDDIFRRHDNCTCTVTFENGRERQDVWSKKKWQVSTALEVPYQPFYAEKNQAENLQKNQLAKYIGLDKSVMNARQTEMRDFINQNSQKRDYFGEQNYRKISYTDSQSDSDFANKIRNTLTGKKYLNTLNDFAESLQNMENKKVSFILASAYKNTAFEKSPRKNSYFSSSENKVYIAKNVSPSTVAHELFHKIDHDNNVTVSGFLDKCITSDYKNLKNSAEKAGLSLEDMLYLNYPEAFEKKGKMKEEYRGFSDIINGMTKGEVKLGYGHNKAGYWDKPLKLQKETFAQYGRFYYENNPDVIRMINENLPETSKQMEKIINVIFQFGG